MDSILFFLKATHTNVKSVSRSQAAAYHGPISLALFHTGEEEGASRRKR